VGFKRALVPRWLRVKEKDPTGQTVAPFVHSIRTQRESEGGGHGLSMATSFSVKRDGGGGGGAVPKESTGVLSRCSDKVSDTQGDQCLSNCVD